jgi:voltage-gated potassium channel
MGSERGSLRDRYTRWFEVHEVAWELTMAALSVAFVVVGLVAESASEAESVGYTAIEIGLTAFFMAEFGTRIAASRDRRRYLRGHWIDLLALIPTIRGFRLFRLVRLLRLVRAFAGVYRALSRIERFAANRTLVLLFMAWLTVAIICSSALYFAESGVNPAIREPMDAFWWGLVTLSTVGYGDVFPLTGEGRLAAAALMILGITLWAAITGTITSALVAEKGSGVPGGPDVPALIRRYGELHRDGYLTDDEFAAKKAELLGPPR